VDWCFDRFCRGIITGNFRLDRHFSVTSRRGALVMPKTAIFIVDALAFVIFTTMITVAIQLNDQVLFAFVKREVIDTQKPR
jgi:hypothetical protein